MSLFVHFFFLILRALARLRLIASSFFADRDLPPLRLNSDKVTPATRPHTNRFDKNYFSEPFFFVEARALAADKLMFAAVLASFIIIPAWVLRALS